MKREPVEGVQPEVLRWARETVGLSIDEVATMLRAAPSEVADWETGAGAPTYAQLEKLAYQVFKRPLAVFFFRRRPRKRFRSGSFARFRKRTCARLLATPICRSGKRMHSSYRSKRCLTDVILRIS
ncbi:helix-turn-helix domain-containing protein [Burkholderia cenocepacia]|uniref:helix-turn-helix domain-containing protein n=1 Tax=Burkholderia cenocepacia TaxID=95486 RepID=UPI002A36B151|nr:helix-turn-helix transcriptional regulator [Burkholderia cenocepacia]